MRLVKEARSIISDNKTPGVIITLANFITGLCAAIIVVHMFSYYYENKFFNEIQDTFKYSQAIYRRGIAITDARYYNRHLELISSGLIKGNKTQLYNTTANKLRELSIELEKLEVRCLAAISYMEFVLGVRTSFEYPMYYKLADGGEKEITTPFQDAIYQYISSLSIVVNAEANQMNRDLEKSGEQLTTARAHFHRINFNSLNSLRIGNIEVLANFRSFMKTRIDYFSVFIFVPLSVVAIIVTFGSVSTIYCMVRIFEKNKEVLNLFGMINEDQIEELVDEIEFFVVDYLSDFLIAEDLDKSYYNRHLSHLTSHFQNDDLDEEEDDYEEEKEEEDEDYEEEKVEAADGVSDLLSEAIPRKRRGLINSDYDNLSIKDESGHNHTKRNRLNVANNIKPKTIFSINAPQDPQQEPLKPPSAASRKISSRIKAEEPNLSRVSNRTFRMDSKLKRTTLLEGNFKVGRNKRGTSGNILRKVGRKNKTLKSLKSDKDGSRSRSGRLGDEENKKLGDGDDEYDELISARIQKMKEQAGTNDRGLIRYFMIPVTISAFALTFSKIFIKYQWAETARFVHENIYMLGITPNNIKLAYNLMYESLAELQYPYEYNGKFWLRGFDQGSLC